MRTARASERKGERLVRSPKAAVILHAASGGLGPTQADLGDGILSPSHAVSGASLRSLCTGIFRSAFRDTNVVRRLEIRLAVRPGGARPLTDLRGPEARDDRLPFGLRLLRRSRLLFTQRQSGCQDHEKNRNRTSVHDSTLRMPLCPNWDALINIGERTGQGVAQDGLRSAPQPLPWSHLRRPSPQGQRARTKGGGRARKGERLVRSTEVAVIRSGIDSLPAIRPAPAGRDRRARVPLRSSG